MDSCALRVQLGIPTHVVLDADASSGSDIPIRYTDRHRIRTRHSQEDMGVPDINHHFYLYLKVTALFCHTHLSRIDFARVIFTSTSMKQSKLSLLCFCWRVQKNTIVQDTCFKGIFQIV